MDAGWFIDEVRARTRHCDFPPLVTTATDGDNGGWFRNTTARLELLDQLLPRARRARPRRGGRQHPPDVHHRPPSPPRRPRLGHRRIRAPGIPVTTTARDSSNGPARPRSARVSLGSRSSATPSGPPCEMRLPTTRAPWSAWSKPAGASCARRRAATSTGARPGSSAATTTSTPPPHISSMRRVPEPDRQARGAASRPTGAQRGIAGHRSSRVIHGRAACEREASWSLPDLPWRPGITLLARVPVSTTSTKRPRSRPVRFAPLLVARFELAPTASAWGAGRDVVTSRRTLPVLPCCLPDRPPGVLID